MKTKTHLIYKSLNTCFPTQLPVYFYGTSEGNVVVLFTQFKTDNLFDKTQEWVLANHSDFFYNYEFDTILTHDSQEVGFEEFTDLADNFDQRIVPFKTFGAFTTITEAQQYFNVYGPQMLSSVKPSKSKSYSYYTEWQLQ